MSEPIRLQRFIAQAGLASRRKAELLIQAGRVRVNGQVVTELGTKVDPTRDRVEVDGKRLHTEDLAYVLLNKPQGYVTTLSDPEGRPTVKDLLPEQGPRLFPVGRLDVASEGTLLCTNDGDLAHALTHPSHQVKKTYLVRVRGAVDEATLQALSTGPVLEDGPTRPTLVLVRAETASHTWLEVTVTEGRNRLVRRMCEVVGLEVMRLIRASFAGLAAEPLRKGAWRTLTSEEVARLRRLAGLPPQRHRPRLSSRGRQPTGRRGRGAGRARSAGRRGRSAGSKGPRREPRDAGSKGPRREPRDAGSKGPRREPRDAGSKGPRREPRDAGPGRSNAPRGQGEGRRGKPGAGRRPRRGGGGPKGGRHG